MLQHVTYDCVDVCADSMLVFFFFQAEDGIRDLTVTGVQTCALPIFGKAHVRALQRYQQRLANVTGIDAKTMLESTLFGLPMIAVNMPGARIPAAAEIGRASCRERV